MVNGGPRVVFCVVFFSGPRLKSSRRFELCLTASVVKMKSSGHLVGALNVDRDAFLTVLKILSLLL